MQKIKLDKITIILNVILSILYIPFSLFSWLLAMASESTFVVTNKTYILLINVFCYITLTIPFICILSILLSFIFRKQQKSVLSFVIQFLPIMVFFMNLGLLFFTESIK